MKLKKEDIISLSLRYLGILVFTLLSIFNVYPFNSMIAGSLQ
jgi:hypothetical protein